MKKNNQENTFLQVWDYLLENPELDNTDVILLAKIISLGNAKDGCYMTNDYICKLVKLKNNESASRRISNLEKLGYIKCLFTGNKKDSKKTKRYIYPTYQNGLTQKSIRIDSKVNDTLIPKSISIDSKVNQPLTQESTNNINYNINV